MEAWQQNVIDEKADLDAKLERLEVFYRTSKFRLLPEDEQLRLTHQGYLMELYSSVLKDRIAAF